MHCGNIKDTFLSDLPGGTLAVRLTLCELRLKRLCNYTPRHTQSQIKFPYCLDPRFPTADSQTSGSLK